MRQYLLATGLSILLSMGIGVMIVGMEKTRTMIIPVRDQLDFKLKNLDATFEDREFLRSLLRQQLERQQKLVKDLEAEVEKITPERDEKKGQNDACQAEKNTKNEELAAVEKDKSDTEATQKTERDAWTAEAETLKNVHKAYSKVCDYVKKDAQVGDLCPAAAAAAQPAAPAAEQPAAPAAEQPAAPAAAQPAAAA